MNMKKIIPFLIIVFVFGFVLTTGFLIVKASITSDTSNAKLIEAFIHGPTSTTPAITFTHLAAADAVFAAKPQTPEAIAAGYFAPIAPPTAAATSTDTATSTDASSSTPSQAEEAAIAQAVNQQMAVRQLSR